MTVLSGRILSRCLTSVDFPEHEAPLQISALMSRHETIRSKCNNLPNTNENNFCLYVGHQGATRKRNNSKQQTPSTRRFGLSQKTVLRESGCMRCPRSSRSACLACKLEQSQGEIEGGRCTVVRENNRLDGGYDLD